MRDVPCSNLLTNPKVHFSTHCSTVQRYLVNDSTVSGQRFNVIWSTIQRYPLIYLLHIYLHGGEMDKIYIRKVGSIGTRTRKDYKVGGGLGFRSCKIYWGEKLYTFFITKYLPT
uniref:Uncharacterized protein n=1 Tax=Cacopsylla melanoneura TaxID=428564 RepID=A0A8D8WKU5_9HEMI